MEQGFIVHAFERSRSGRMEIDLVGRLANGETFAVVERRARPFLAVREADFASVRTVIDREGDGISVTSWPRTTMDGAPTLRLEVATPIRLRDLRESLHRAGVRTYEADVKPSIQLLVDAGIHAAVSIEGPWRAGRRVQRVYEDPAIGPAGAGFEPRLSVLSLDIETDRTGRAVWAVGLAFTGHDGAESSRGAPERRGRGLGTLLPVGEGPPARAAPADPRAGPRHPDRLEHRGLRFPGAAPPVRRPRRAVRHRPVGQPGHVPRPGGRRGRRALAAQPGHRGRAAGDGRALAGAPFRHGARGLPARDRGAGAARPGQADRPAARREQRRGHRAALPHGSGSPVRLLSRRRPARARHPGERGVPRHGAAQVAADRHHARPDVGQRRLVRVPLPRAPATGAAWWPPPSGSTRTRWSARPGGGLITPRAGLADNVLAFDFRSLYPSLIRTFNIDPLTRVVDAGYREAGPRAISSSRPTARGSGASPASCPTSSSGSSWSAPRRSAAGTSGHPTRTRS